MKTIQLEIQDHAHGGGQITVREVIVKVTSLVELIKAILKAMGDYPICIVTVI